MKPKKAARPTSRLRWCSTRSLRILVVTNVSEEGSYGGSESLLIKASVVFVAAQGDDRLGALSLVKGSDALIPTDQKIPPSQSMRRSVGP